MKQGYSQDALSLLAKANGLNPLPKRIEKGNLYLACKNSGPKLLTCKENNGSFIVPIEKYEYCFNACDCMAVE